MANYTALGREGDFGATPPVPYWSPPSGGLTGGAYDASLTRYQQGGLDAPIAVATYTPAGQYAGALASQPPAPQGATVTQGTFPAGNTPTFTIPATDIPGLTQTPNLDASGGNTPAPTGLPAWDINTGYTPNTDGPVPQTITQAPNITQDVQQELANLTPQQYAGQTPNLYTPAGGFMGGGGGAVGGTGGGNKGSSGGGSSGGASPQQQQQPQQRPTSNPVTILINSGGVRPGAGGGALRPSGVTTNPAGYTPSGQFTGAGAYTAGGALASSYSPATGAAGLFSGANSNLMLALIFGGGLLYAASKSK